MIILYSQPVMDIYSLVILMHLTICNLCRTGILFYFSLFTLVGAKVPGLAGEEGRGEEVWWWWRGHADGFLNGPDGLSG